MELLLGALSLLLGLAIGLGLGKLFFTRTTGIAAEAFRTMETQKTQAESRLAHVETERQLALELKNSLEIRMMELERTRATLEAERRHLEERIVLLQKDQDGKVQALQSQMQSQFENLATKIFEKNSVQFRENSERTLTTLINPLRERIQDFQKRVEDTYSQESRERFALKTEIERIVQANEKITLEAGNLTRALRGDVKAQGNWGEFVLNQILEASGLREGHEYVVQGKGMGLKSEDGRDQRPDIIIQMPQGKHLIVDSKVSLTHYERFAAESTDEGRVIATKLYLESLYAHVDGLSKKRYQDLEGLTAPDFVMLFVPTEGAFSFAMQKDAGLFKYAWDKTVVIVGPTTLLATLRTVAEIWKQEQRSRNAEEIAKHAGLLYDKLAGFVTDMQTIEEKLKGAQDAYERAMGKLSTGRGNVLTKAQQMVKLGARASKQLPAELLTSSEEEPEQESLSSDSV